RDHRGVIDLAPLGPWPDAIPTVIVHGDAEHGKAAILVRALEIHKPGSLNFARPTPGGPEVQKHHLAAIILERNGTAVRALQLESGGFMTNVGGFDSGPFGDLRRARDERGDRREEDPGSQRNSHFLRAQRHVQAVRLSLPRLYPQFGLNYSR